MAAAPSAPGPAAARRALPDFPWDRLAPYRRLAEQAAGDAGIVDLSVGTPVDPVPSVIREALAAAADSPGYPTTHGTSALRDAAVGWMERCLGVTGVDPSAVLPTIGSKELVAWLPTLLGLGAGDTVVLPEAAYPTYAVGALLAGAEPFATDALTAVGPARVGLVWLNSPANPTGRVLPVEHLRKVVEWARERGAVVASDECYIELGWEGPEPVSVLHPDVCGGSHEGLLAVHSLSKRSNFAGYRAGFVSGDPALVSRLLEVRKHAGMMLPSPVQAAAAAALRDDAHVTEQKERYRARRALLLGALNAAGFRVDSSEAGLYLWATRDEDCWETVRSCAERGVLVTPGEFYGAAGARHVRVALTATDEAVRRGAEALAV
ncbi:succinyldiaminopimelate transaminase [Motilibacter deserti]|uniref:Aminotransferase n=1 Tax=Motilibacter deserti TaxID=2714956 RepID=A0ABX0GQP7_9ACTN|nr:succinyldiaminopimelate transaminase [Motilibacter deserti]NHC13168.1 succinyldiaminopimelate transaminase [Motilibacter deserti]